MGVGSSLIAPNEFLDHIWPFFSQTRKTCNSVKKSKALLPLVIGDTTNSTWPRRSTSSLFSCTKLLPLVTAICTSVVMVLPTSSTGTYSLLVTHSEQLLTRCIRDYLNSTLGADSTVAIADADRGFWYIGVYGFSACSYSIKATTTDCKCLLHRGDVAKWVYWQICYQLSAPLVALTTVTASVAAALNLANAMLATWATIARLVSHNSW